MFEFPSLSLMEVVRYVTPQARQRIPVVNPVVLGIDLVATAFTKWNLDAKRWQSEITANKGRTTLPPSPGGNNDRWSLSVICTRLFF